MIMGELVQHTEILSPRCSRQPIKIIDCLRVVINPFQNKIESSLACTFLALIPPPPPRKDCTQARIYIGVTSMVSDTIFETAEHCNQRLIF